MTQFKTLDGKWVEGYRYMTWPLDKNGNRIMPGCRWQGWKLRRSTRNLYEFMVPGGTGQTFMATECREQ